MSFENYYELCGLNQSYSADVIQSLLEQKIEDEEHDTYSDGHAERLSTLKRAMAAFASPESKEQYDRELAESQRVADPDGERKAAFEKWYGDAKNYHEKEQYDLAKTALEEALKYVSKEQMDLWFFCDASRIYSHAGEHQQALAYANQAIVREPEMAEGYACKFLALNRNDDLVLERNSQAARRMALELCLEKADKTGDICRMAWASAVLASGIYFGWLGEKDQIRAEELAIRSMSFGVELESAKDVLNDIAERRNKIKTLVQKIADIREENAQLEGELSDLRNNKYRSQEFINRSRRGKFLTTTSLIGIVILVLYTCGVMFSFLSTPSFASFTWLVILLGICFFVFKKYLQIHKEYVHTFSKMIEEKKNRFGVNNDKIKLFEEQIQDIGAGIRISPTIDE